MLELTIIILGLAILLKPRIREMLRQKPIIQEEQDPLILSVLDEMHLLARNGYGIE